MIVVEVSKAEGTDERRRIGMLADLAVDDTGFPNLLNGQRKGLLLTNGHAIARSAAGRRLGLDAWEIQSNNLLDGYNVSMAGRAMGVCTLPLNLKPHAF